MIQIRHEPKKTLKYTEVGKVRNIREEVSNYSTLLSHGDRSKKINITIYSKCKKR